LSTEYPLFIPFTDETLAWSVGFSELLQSFAEALSKPLARSDDINDYLHPKSPCEYAESLRYDGVRYSSAMNDEGVNLVLFDPNTVEILDSTLVEVTSVKSLITAGGFRPRKSLQRPRL
jgi:RES domain